MVTLICPTCRGPLGQYVDGHRCRACQRQYPMMAWGPSFLLEGPSRPDVRGELDARNREAATYERRQQQTKGTSFLDLHRRAVLTALSAIPDGPLLDAGCGTGLLTGPLAATGRPVVAVDFSENSLALLAAKQLANTTLIHASLAQLPLPDKTFGAIVCSLVIQHMPRDIRSAALSELARCLLPGGALIAVAYNRARFHVRGLPPEGMYQSGVPYFSFSHRDLQQAALAVGLPGARVHPLGICLLLKTRRGGAYLYRRWHPVLNRLEGALGPYLPANRPYPSEYWLMQVQKPRDDSSPRARRGRGQPADMTKEMA